MKWQKFTSFKQAWWNHYHLNAPDEYIWRWIINKGAHDFSIHSTDFDELHKVHENTKTTLTKKHLFRWKTNIAIIVSIRFALEIPSCRAVSSHSWMNNFFFKSPDAARRGIFEADFWLKLKWRAGITAVKRQSQVCNNLRNKQSTLWVLIELCGVLAMASDASQLVGFFLIYF